MGTGNRKVDFGECTQCGYLMLPVLPLSPCGHDGPVETKPLEAPGKVYSWTKTRLGDSDEFIVMADFFEGRLRVTAPLLGTDQVAIGDSVLLMSSDSGPYELHAIP